VPLKVDKLMSTSYSCNSSVLSLKLKTS
jgi:hypothetical protein